MPFAVQLQNIFADASFAVEDTGIMTEKHFFGTRHGKGPCDAEIGVVKCVAFLAIRWRRRVIANAQDLLCFGKQFLTRPKQQYLHCHIWHMFVHVGSGDVNRCRPS